MLSFFFFFVLKFIFDNIVSYSNGNAFFSLRPNVILVGGSFIAMEAAAYFADKANCVVMSRRNPLESALGRHVSFKLRELHESKGVKFVISDKFDVHEFIESAERRGSLGSIKLDDGSVHAADLCLMAIGSRPATAFLDEYPGERVTRTRQGNLSVDSWMRTKDPNVFAVGDVAAFPITCLANIRLNNNNNSNEKEELSLGHFGVAGAQGRCAALAIAEEDGVADVKAAPLKIVPFFWTVHYGKSVRFAGYTGHSALSPSATLVHTDEQINPLKFAVFYFNSEQDDGDAIAVCSLDWDPVCALFVELMHKGVRVKREHVKNDPLDMRRLLA